MSTGKVIRVTDRMLEQLAPYRAEICMLITALSAFTGEQLSGTIRPYWRRILDDTIKRAEEHTKMLMHAIKQRDPLWFVRLEHESLIKELQLYAGLLRSFTASLERKHGERS